MMTEIQTALLNALISRNAAEALEIINSHNIKEVDFFSEEEDGSAVYLALKNTPDVVLTLIENGADVNTPSQGIGSGAAWTPLHYALWHRMGDEIVLPLIKATSVEEISRSDKDAPLLYVKSAAATQALIDKGANINVSAHYGKWEYNPLDQAYKAAHNDAAIVLLENGAVSTLAATINYVLCTIGEQLTPKSKQAITSDITKFGSTDKWLACLAQKVGGEEFNITAQMKVAAKNIFETYTLLNYMDQYTPIAQQIHGNPPAIALQHLTNARAADKADEVLSLTTLCVREILKLNLAKLFSEHISAIEDANVAALGGVSSMENID